jgi:uncharacterized iron-regulated membrane protein
MGVTGGLVALRPQIATLLSPAAPATGNCVSPDWNRAAHDITALSGSEINRVYGPYGADTRYHFRMMTDEPAIYRHVIYDVCSARILGSINLAWMDWTVDLHHNLLAGKTGRMWAGMMGILMLVSGIGGVLLWLLGKPDLRTAFQIRLRFSKATPRQAHRALGLIAGVVLVLEAFTGLWLCFPQTMRGMLTIVSPVSEDVRPARAPRGKAATGRADFNELLVAAHKEIPDGVIREIRMPEGNGNVQIRMWRPADFRSLGNNVVFLSSAGAQVLAVDRYVERPGSNRFIQAMAGLHYDEWGGLPFRILCAVAGLATPVLFITGWLMWWYSRGKQVRSLHRPTPTEQTAALAR